MIGAVLLDTPSKAPGDAREWNQRVQNGKLARVRRSPVLYGTRAKTEDSESSYVEQSLQGAQQAFHASHFATNRQCRRCWDSGTKRMCPSWTYSKGTRQMH